MHNNKKFSNLMRRTNTACNVHLQLSLEITVAFEARYGSTFSALDIDTLIKSFDYGGTFSLSVKDVDALMAEAGYPLIEPTPTQTED